MARHLCQLASDWLVRVGGRVGSAVKVPCTALRSAMAIASAVCRGLCGSSLHNIFATVRVRILMERRIVVVAAVLQMLEAEGVDARKPCLERQRVVWQHHANLLLLEGQFKQYYRMSLRSFEKLTLLLAPCLLVDEDQSRRRTGGAQPISPVNKVQMFISWLAGFSFHPVRALSGVSKSAFYISVHQVMDAIQASGELQLQFPVTEYQQRRSAAAFAGLSNQRALVGCVGAIDGWLCNIQVPRRREVNRVSSFFSGHYQRYGVNVQAAVDHRSRFTAICCASPGGMGDSLAFMRWSVSGITESFPVGLFLAGDNAYSNSNNLLTPFTRPQLGDLKKNPFRDSFNFHLSQLRIRVEMAFGLLVNKWRIFKSPLRVSMKNVKKVVHVACILHNYCIDERIIENGECDIDDDEDLAPVLSSHVAVPIAFDTTVSHEDTSSYRTMYDSTQVYPEQTSESELLRNAYVEKLRKKNISRPSYNVKRAAKERG